ncbi:MAG: hypothetical protein ACFFF4_05325 [Candidatus Thorarchaeota archaeon]
MVEYDSREKFTISNPMFLKIRQAALDKAFTEVRNKRFHLDESRSKGRISEEEYQQNLLKLILEGNEIKNQQKIIEEQLDI